MIGQTITHYRIVEKLGEGGMGVVYKAEDTQLRRTVALKFLAPQALGESETKTRLIREAQAAAALDHPNICSVYGIHEEKGQTFIAMAYIDGVSLASKIQQRPLAVEEALSVAIQIGEGLQEAHEQGVVHRDIKPANIMLTRKGQAKVMDFGLAYLAGRSKLTKSGSTMGTPVYMSPEQALGQPADRRSDTWSLGVVLYEMLAGKPPFESEHEQAIVYSIINEAFEPLTARRTGLPLEVDRVIAKVLAKKPDERYQHVEDLLVDLRALRTRCGLGERKPLAPVPAAVPAGREKLAWALAAVLLLAALAPWVFRSGPTAVAPPTHRSSLLPPPEVYFAPYGFAVSPDGQRLAFVGVAADGRETLWVRALNSRGAQQLNDTDEASLPFWSPDSRRIGFFTTQSLKIVDTATNTVQILCDAPGGRGGSWNGQGTIVFSASRGGPLFSVSERGGVPSQVTQVEPQSGRAHRWPVFLPDNRHFLYYQTFGVSSLDSPDGTYVGSLDGGAPILLSSEILSNVEFASGHLVYLQERSLMARLFDPDRLQFSAPAIRLVDQELDLDVGWGRSAFSASRTGDVVFRSVADSNSELTWFDRDGKEHGHVADAGVRYPRFSPDGRFLVAVSDEARNGKHDIRVRDLQRGVVTRLTNGGGENAGLWTPDGSNIAYYAPGESSGLYQIRSDGVGNPVLILEGQRLAPNDYSPDGRYLAYMTFDKGPPDQMILDTVKGESVFVSAGGEGQFSPDGKWLAYASLPGVFVQPFPGTGARIQIFSNASQPRWSRDGKRLYFVAADRKLMEAAIEVSSGTLRPSAARPLFQTHIIVPRFNLHQYDVTPDESLFLINSLKPEAPLTLITNWPQLLER